MDMSLSKLQELVIDKEAWRASPWVEKIQTWLSDWTELNNGINKKQTTPCNWIKAALCVLVIIIKHLVQTDTYSLEGKLWQT